MGILIVGDYITRRRFALQAASVLGLSIAPSIISGCSNYRPDLAKAKSYLNTSRYLILEKVCDTIIPDTDTPGAKAAGVPGFIDHILKECIGDLGNQIVLTFLDSIHSSVSVSNKEQLYTLLAKMDEQRVMGSKEMVVVGYGYIRAWTILGYYTSSIGSCEELACNPNPGGFEGNVSFNEIGRAWSDIDM